MTKSIRVSSDASTYYTLPGNNGEITDDLGELDDTIFGQDYKSGQPNLIGWSINANALYKGFAGYNVTLKKQNVSTTMTGEATTLAGTKTYQINNASKRIWDRTAAFTVLDGVTDVTAQVLFIDFLFGRVIFKASYTIVGAITVTGKYFTTATLAKYRGFTLTMTQDPIDITDIPTAQGNSGHMSYAYGLKTVSLDVNGVYAVANGYRASLVAREELIIEIDPVGSGKAIARGYFKPLGRSQSGNIGELEEESASFVLSVPTTALLLTPFRWEFASVPDISIAVQKCIEAYLNETDLTAEYTDNGSTGHRGTVIVADISLAGGLESMNEFSVNLQGKGSLTAY